jgi:hypothetical protein
MFRQSGKLFHTCTGLSIQSNKSSDSIKVMNPLINWLIPKFWSTIRAISWTLSLPCVLHLWHYKKQSRYTPWRRLGGVRWYSSYSFTTSALDWGEWSASRPGRALPPGKGPPVPIGEEAGWAPEPVWTQSIEEKSLAPAGDRTPIARSSSP